MSNQEVTPSVFFNRHRNVFLKVKEGSKYHYFLAFYEGRLSAVRIDSTELPSLTPAEISREDAIDRFMKATATSSAAGKVLSALSNESSLPNLDSVPLVNADREEEEKPEPEHKWNFPDRELDTESDPKKNVGLADAKRQLTAPSKPRILKPNKNGELEEEKTTEKKKRVPPTRAIEPGYIPLQEICLELGIEPASARKKLRSNGTRAPDGRWAWPKKEVESIRKLLTK